MMTQYWLFKTEPGTYSFDQLKADKKTAWNGVRNFQARNFLRSAKNGDLALIYHSGDERAVVGVAKIISSPYPEIDKKKPGEWIQLNCAYERKLRKPVPLASLKSNKALKDLMMIKQSRLSCMPVTQKEFETIVNLSDE
jgi:predicted RNA-binding protein with PUA-like domain